MRMWGVASFVTPASLAAPAFVFTQLVPYLVAERLPFVADDSTEDHVGPTGIDFERGAHAQRNHVARGFEAFAQILVHVRVAGQGSADRLAETPAHVAVKLED